MKILIFTNDADGLFLFRKELIMALLDSGREVYAALPFDENIGKLYKAFNDNDKVHFIETSFERRGHNAIQDIGLIRRYIKLLRRIKPDVVLTYTIKPNIYGGLACQLKKIPYICNITGLGTAIEDGGILSRLLISLYRAAMKKANCVFFQNKRNRDFMARHRIAKNNSRLLPGSGVNLTEHPFEDYPPEDKHICFLAVIRIMKDKGIDEYLEAARIMRERHKGLKFYLVGEYEEETRGLYEPIIEELQSKKIIKYLGHIDNVAEVMAKTHIIVHPSYHEGLSNVLLEAAACGRPVLASDINGCVETFAEGESGFAFEAKSTDALVEAMEKIIALSTRQRRSMGIAGRAWVEENFDRNIVIKAYMDEINKI